MALNLIFKVVVAGGRNFHDYQLVWQTLDKLLFNKSQTHKIVIISGKANGADSLGERYAKQRGYEIEEHPADWLNINAPNAVIKERADGVFYNAIAGHTRNEVMAKSCHVGVVFWDGKSKGTANMIGLLEKYNKPCRVIKYHKF